MPRFGLSPVLRNPRGDFSRSLARRVPAAEGGPVADAVTVPRATPPARVYHCSIRGAGRRKRASAPCAS
jgi:hypothetical protein